MCQEETAKLKAAQSLVSFGDTDASAEKERTGRGRKSKKETRIESGSKAKSRTLQQEKSTDGEEKMPCPDGGKAVR